MLMSSRNEPAKLHYGPNDFRILRTGRFVHCAVSGTEIELEDLRDWSAELQEPYASAEIATKRLIEIG